MELSLCINLWWIKRSCWYCIYINTCCKPYIKTNISNG